MTQTRRGLDWIGAAFDARSGRPTPTDYLDAYLPIFDAFGTSRLPELQAEQLTGAVGGLELAHDAVPRNRWRYYVAVEFWHDDAVNRLLAPARIVQTAAGFPIVRLRDEVSVPALQRLAVRQVGIGPGDRVAIETRTIGAGASLFLSVAWLELPVGESVYHSL